MDRETLRLLEKFNQLSLTEEERAKAMKEMDKILEYVSKLNEIDTDGVEPLVNVLPINNVLREDEVVEEDEAVERTIVNGPVTKVNMFVAPKTV